MVCCGEYKPESIYPMLCINFGSDEAALECMRWLHDYEDWQRGGLLVDGGTEDQPALWLQRCWIIDGVYAAQRRKDLEKARKGKKG